MARGGMSARASALLCAVLALVVAPSPSAQAQHVRCDPKIKGTPDHLGYKPRRYGCEGMYIGLQSAPLGLQVVSLVRGTIAFDAGDSLMWIRIAEDSGRLPAPVRVVGRARRANVHWALDGEISAKNVLIWDLGQVVKGASLNSDAIGLHGIVDGTDTTSDGPVFVPLWVSEAPPVGSVAAESSDPLQLVLRIPAAAEICWYHRAVGASVAPGSSCEQERPVGGNADGYFEIRLPPNAPREFEVVLRWRPRNLHRFGTPVRLSVRRW